MSLKIVPLAFVVKMDNNPISNEESDNAHTQQCAPLTNAESDHSQTGQPGPKSNAESDNSQIRQPGSVGHPVSNASPIVQPPRSTSIKAGASSNAESDNSQIRQPGSVGDPVSNASPIVQPPRSTSTEPEAIGYLHNISPIKKGKYFEFQLQERSKTVRGVCFSPPKWKLFTELGQNNSPVKIKKYRVDSTAYSEDLLMGPDVVIDTCHDVDFQKQQLPSTMNISNAKLVCPGQITTIRAKVAHTHPPKQVSSKNLLMQNVVIVDPSGTIQLTLWEKYVHQVKAGNTYTFTNIRVRKDRVTGEIVVNSIEADTKIEPATPFQEELPIVVLDSETADVEIVGIEKDQAYLACSKCNKKIENTDTSKFMECSNCHFKQKQTAAVKHWFAQVSIF